MEFRSIPVIVEGEVRYFTFEVRTTGQEATCTISCGEWLAEVGDDLSISSGNIPPAWHGALLDNMQQILDYMQWRGVGKLKDY